MGIDGQNVTTGLFSDVGVRNHVGIVQLPKSW